ncbi:ribonuclease [Chromobacterium alkanivorans]|uniref:ribonuclease domain-containing protein n=1 Tax=Chromobacterium alkanivorans TaxID=1071719 RepID=UPI0019686981|nr:ribonuclease domain-containing protein [Chromobacterium alkanivorans]MBN3005050.1 ribonuclease [Chromobacterium alkanivorans]
MIPRLSRLLALACLIATPAAWALPQCSLVAAQVNQQAGNRLNQNELSAVLSQLGKTGQLPPQFVTKRQAKNAGWQPGRSLWSVPGLNGKSIGGDRFGNYEKRLPKGQWQEADLNYKGGKRGAYRIVFSGSGQRFVTVDHYNRFIEVPPCQ